MIGAGQEAQLVALDVAADAELTVDAGGKLFLYGGTLTPSTIRGRVEVIGATIGGPGRVDVSGTLEVRSLGRPARVTITTRECALFAWALPAGRRAVRSRASRSSEPPDGSWSTTTGSSTSRVAGSTSLTSSSSPCTGSSASTTMDSWPPITVPASSCCRAPRPPRAPARFGSRTTATTSRGATTPVSPSWGTVVNQGLIIKSGGNGTTLLTGAYSQPAPGAVTVGSGTLLLPSGSPTPASVAAGAGYGSGRCLTPDPGCLEQTFGVDRQNVQFQVPTEDSTGASVLIQELPPRRRRSTSAIRWRRTPPASRPLPRLPRSCRFTMTNGSWTGGAGPRSTCSGARGRRPVRRPPALSPRRGSARGSGRLRGPAGARRKQPQRGRCRGSRQCPRRDHGRPDRRHLALGGSLNIS